MRWLRVALFTLLVVAAGAYVYALIEGAPQWVTAASLAVATLSAVAGIWEFFTFRTSAPDAPAEIIILESRTATGMIKPPAYRILDLVRHAARRGWLAVNAPDRMRQGRTERVTVGLAREDEWLSHLLAEMQVARDHADLTAVTTADYMEVRLEGKGGFEITSLSSPGQLIAPTARWQFDVLPVRRGQQTLTVIGTCWFAVPGLDEKPISLPSFEKRITVKVSIGWSARRVVANHWKWAVASLIALAGALSGWIAYFQDKGWL